mmetsp:Transcript_54811/g.86756  ORF Transcript_54811/g.86756 Transcript_54811/m.86756 type:complete len:117 (+) Transcript_54811:447-797(+)
MLKAKRYESQPTKPDRSRSLQLVAKCGFDCFQLSEHMQRILGSQKSVDGTMAFLFLGRCDTNPTTKACNKNRSWEQQTAILKNWGNKLVRISTLERPAARMQWTQWTCRTKCRSEP